ncbi:MAG: hypothetical protein K2N48_07245 [Muribaculaceae bacterium]|nr:hypothetical protein [Muribaculaceae bacterium]
MTVSESLLQIAELTKQNLQILQVLNDSFYTKSNHLSTTVGEVTYTIPSYIALENKVNHVQDAFNNLVHAAKSGEAWFNFDGNSREIKVIGYQQAPSPVDLKAPEYFETESRQLFKDMLTPQPYLGFDMSELPDDVTQVRVKKVIPYHTTLRNILDIGDEAMRAMTWAELISKRNSADKDFEPGKDYLEYESIYTLPIRNCTRSGSYVIEEILTDQITENFENVISVRISDLTPLLRTEFDGIEKTYLEANDVLVTYDGSAKLRIKSINIAARTMELIILSGEYVNPIAAGKDIKVAPGATVFDSVSDYSILKLYSSPDTNRELHIPLEEDDLVYITVAPINPRLNIQTTWGTGLVVKTGNLRMEDGTAFKSYYDKNVANIGDAMIELATIAYPSITKYSQDDWQKIKSAENLGEDNIRYSVVQINKHLNDSDAVKNIRALYSQKKQYQTDLAEVQARIASLTESLAEISFDDMSGTRSAYTAQIAELKDQQNNLITSINKIVDNISLAANNAEIPIEAGKFRIRGYFDIESYIKTMASAFGLGQEDYDQIDRNLLGIEVRYRYRNSDIPQANVSVIDEFLFTEWSVYQPPYRERYMNYDKGQYTLEYQPINYSANEPKFNQIDIPISQGETVEMQVRVVWGFGHPFIKTATDWSNIQTIDFPPELVKDVQVTTIIEENNSDIETNRFETILRTKGVTGHIEDEIDDQDVKFFHKPESISSGFYTPERRIIPLKDKLIDMDSKITEVTDMIQGTTSEALTVQVVVDNVAVGVLADIENIIQLPAYNGIKSYVEGDTNVPTGTSFKDKYQNAYVTASIVLKNNTNHTVNLFSVMPGARNTEIADLENVRYPKTDFVATETYTEGPEQEEDNTASDNIATLADMATGPGLAVIPGLTEEVDEKVELGDVKDEVANDDAGEIEKPSRPPKPSNPVIEKTRNVGPIIVYPVGDEFAAKMQSANQVITYRRTNPYNNAPLSTGGLYPELYMESHEKGNLTEPLNEGTLNVWPITTSEYGMCIESDAVSSKLVLAPGESVQYALQIEYRMGSISNTSKSYTLAFNVRNSLYLDPLYYEITFVAKYNQSATDLLSSAKTSVQGMTKYSVVVR